MALNLLVFAEIDSGGGKSTIAAHTNHGSIGGSFATNTVSSGTPIIKSGLVEVLYAGAIPSDANENGLPDTWEKEHFGEITVEPLSDTDGDGNNNLLEFLAGTDPNDDTSYFRPKGNQKGTTYTMPIQTMAGRKYDIYVSRDLDNWHLFETYTGDDSQKLFNFDEANIPAGPLHSEAHPSTYFFKVLITIE